ncbi:right-handed parallel beta-helix repeat-containing protein, partial [Algoriphagus antarcticus]|uniref:right-handed parallel beta-helix repeat-containing protein n=2 Tax=Algoriphagus antarcticus TaxID=238540 RepID=UPI00147412A7
MRNFYTLKRGFFLPVLAGIFFQFLVGGHQANSQELTGTYTIGLGGNYATFTEAVESLTSNGVSGPVTFNVLDGVYDEQILIGPITGSSATNSITFQSQSANPELVQLSFAASTVAGNYVVSLEGTSHLIFKNLKIKASGTTYARTVRGQLTLNNLLFQGCVFESPIANATSSERGNVVFTAVNSPEIRFLDNTFLGGSYGIYFQGTNSSSIRAFGFLFTGNTVIDSYYRGISFSRFLDSKVEDNTIVILPASSSGSVGMELTNVDGETRVVGNRISGSKSTGLEYTFSNGSGTTPGLIANNYIQSSGSYALYFYYNTNQRVYHNSTNSTGTGVGLHYNGAASSNNLIKNNIFKANTGYSVDVTSSTGLVEMDYNDLYTSGTYLARWGSTNVADLLAWRTISSKDLNSLSFNPQFLSETDLIANSPALANAGTPIAVVTTDINGVARKATPSMGANEYESAGLTPLSGIYTIDLSGSGVRNFSTIQSTVDAMVLNGVAGAVTFQMASGTYAEQVVIPDISGGSSSNTVTYESATGNRADVIIQFTATGTADNYVIQLDNASDLIFRNLTLKALGVGFGRTLVSVNRL